MNFYNCFCYLNKHLLASIWATDGMMWILSKLKDPRKVQTLKLYFIIENIELSPRKIIIITTTIITESLCTRHLTLKPAFSLWILCSQPSKIHKQLCRWRTRRRNSKSHIKIMHYRDGTSVFSLFTWLNPTFSKNSLVWILPFECLHMMWFHMWNNIDEFLFELSRGKYTIM